MATSFLIDGEAVIAREDGTPDVHCTAGVILAGRHSSRSAARGGRPATPKRPLIVEGHCPVCRGSRRAIPAWGCSGQLVRVELFSSFIT